jgi:hypothetical protein
MPPERIEYYSEALMIDGVEAHRVQQFGSSSDKSREKLQELANKGAVQWRSALPAVSITVNTNDVGSTDTMALACDKMIVKALATETDGPRGGNYRWFIKAASSNAQIRDIDQDDMLSCYCDFMAPVTEDGDEVTRVMWVHRAALTGISYSYDVNGFATENYTFTADNKRWFLGDWKHARIYKPYNIANASSVGSGANAQSWLLASAIPDGSQLLFYCNNDQIYGNASVTGIGSEGTITASTVGSMSEHMLFIHTTGASLDSAIATDNVHFVYLPPLTAQGITWERPNTQTGRQSTAPGYEIESVSTSFGGVSRGYIEAYLYNTDGPFGETTSTTAGVTLRLQTVNIDYSSTEEELLQLSYAKRYGYSRIDPVFTVSVTANDSDLDLFARLCATSEGTANQVGIDDFSDSNQLLIKTYKDEDKSTLLRTMRIDNMVVTGENHDVSVGGNAVQEFTFTADNIFASGTGVNITGY